jgi:CBS domain-containing protein
VPGSGRLSEGCSGVWRGVARLHYRPVMKISDVLRNKGEGVVTIRPDDTVAHLLEVLNERGIGAVVVSTDGNDVAGIVSERDVVRHLHRAGADVISGPVSAIMTSEVTTAGKDDDLEGIARTMTEKRIRHMPVVVDGALHSIVSIGDVVKLRIDTLQSERDQLVGYIQQ